MSRLHSGAIALGTPEPSSAVQDVDPAFLMHQPAGRAQRHRALAMLLVSTLLFCVLAPFATVKLPPVAAFIPIYESALLVTDLITAALLFGQYHILRLRALQVLGSGYLFSALLTVGHALSFPGLFSPTGLLGAGSQSTAWIYMFWHGGFPLFVLAYARLKGDERPVGRGPSADSRPAAFAAPVLAVAGGTGLVLLATAGEGALPVILQNNSYTFAMRVTVGCIWLICLSALVALWFQRSRSVLDLWLLVVMSAWLFDIALSAMLNGGRYDLGFYAGRIYGLIASSMVLLELLLENGTLYARLVQIHEDDRSKTLELISARDAAQSATEAKSLFLASMSHEIRTPMNAVIGLTDLVLETNLDNRQRDYLAKVQTSSKALLALLNDILDYSKIEAGRITLEAEEFSAEETIENVGNLFSAKIEEAGLDLFFEIDEDLPLRLIGDPLRLAQVLNNLVGNAIKFTPRGEIVVSAENVSQSDEHVELRFSVRDTGIGLAKEQADRLFEVFAQGDKSIARKYGGTGLGLAICKRLVELMGGGISVYSSPGKGSTFSFTARFAIKHQEVERIDLHRIRGMRALAVDCQQTARLILQQTLQSWRFQVAVTALPDDALYKLKRADQQTPYELLLIDWKTVDLEFIFQARRISAENGSAILPVVIMTTQYALEPVRQAVRDLQSVCVLLKPVTPSRLFEAIVHLQHGEAPQPQMASARKAGLADIMLPIRGARVLLVEDNLVNQQVASAFLEMAGLKVTLANDGLDAVEQVKNASFEVVLMDMQMPEMDGVQATRMIRGLPHAAHLPIIAMTAAAMEEDKQECLAAGMSAHVAKPIDPRQLAHTLLAWVPPMVIEADAYTAAN